MYFDPDINRLSQLNLSGFKDGESVLFCPDKDCGWQTTEHLAMKPECPQCRGKLHIITVNEELRSLSPIEECMDNLL